MQHSLDSRILLLGALISLIIQFGVHERVYTRLLLIQNYLIQ